jgi:PHD/YefM family antitoxin component YafN of YafNO toxin-antitoxin module
VKYAIFNTRGETMRHNIISKAIAINKPMVIIPAEDYKLLLREAGFEPTPKLDREIAHARSQFKKGKTISWQSIKNGLKKIRR